MVDTGELFQHAAAVAAAYRATVAHVPVARPVDLDALRAAFGGPLPVDGTPPSTVLDALVAAAEPGLVGSVGPRYFGFVIGGALDAATAAEIVAAGWDQNAFTTVMSPAAHAAEDAAGTWLKQLLGLPPGASVGFVTGAQQANTVGLAAARHHVLAEVGWDVERHGLIGAPAVRVVGGEERHATIDRSLRVLGLGADTLEPVAADGNGAIDVAALGATLAARPPGPTIVCLQAGNVNTGAVDDLRGACTAARAHGAWVHVDGAFGLWAAANPTTRHLVDGIELADSWACDGHKWLNVPYDSGYAFCAHPQVHADAIRFTAPYLVGAGTSVASLGDLTLDSSRRARGFATWAAIRQLGRTGVAEVVACCCRLARRFADRLAEGGAEVANEVVLNQVLVGFGDDARTDAVVDAVQREGTCWLGGTTWRGRRLMRVSVSNAATTEDDVDRSVAAILRCSTAIDHDA
jgi:glutamate/tyrosine decarboxylase-like PLP-dependent enzyme